MDEQERVDMIVFQTTYEIIYDSWCSTIKHLNLEECLKFKEIYDRFKQEWWRLKGWQKEELFELRRDMRCLNEDINLHLLSLGNVSSSEQPYSSNDPTDDGTWD